MDRAQRRLAAILAADVVGYSRLMQADEAGTLVALKALRKDVVEPLVAKHNGRIFKIAGDGALIEFASAVNAVECAIDLQHAIAVANTGHPDSARVVLRIGINLGDIMVEGSDLYGDSVNIAARLQAMADPGGILIAGSVHDYVRNKVKADFDDLGPQTLKNIAGPLRLYRVASVPRAPTATPTAATAKPSVVVLPFVNMSGDSEQEYFSDGITEDVITALSRLRWFFVIARNTSFAYKGRSIDVKRVARDLGVRYVLEGSVRRSGKAVRVAAQLIDATTGNHIWAERYDRNLTDIFAIQDEITECVAGAIEPELLKTESGLIATRPLADMTGWDLVRQGMWYFHKVTRETHLKARELFRAAATLDPQLPEAHAWLARVSAGLVAYGWSEAPQTDLREGRDAALKAVRLDEKNPYAQYGLAIISAYSNDFERAKGAAEQAIELCPSFALGHLVLGMAQLYSGDAFGAVPALQRGLKLSPYDPQNFVWYCELALAHLFAGEPQLAVEAATKALRVRPDWPTALEIITVCLVAAGRLEDARRYAAQIPDASSRPDDDIFAPLRARNQAWSEQIKTLMAKAKSHS